MSLQLCILASGSSGNCSVVRSPAGALLVDLGLGPRVTAARLDGTGVRWPDVRAVCLTHLDSDHVNASSLAHCARLDIPVHVAAHRADDLLQRDRRLRHLIHPFAGHPFQPLPGLTVRPIPLAHDHEGSHGFVIDGHDTRIGYASDLGHVPQALIDAFADGGGDAGGVNLLAIESNYDPQMQHASQRPWFLKQRIMGGSGHLSNGQAYQAILKILNRIEQSSRALPEHIVLLHRSRQCNCPDVMRRFFSQDPRIAARLTLADQFERSPWLGRRTVAPTPGQQLTLAWG